MNRIILTLVFSMALWGQQWSAERTIVLFDGRSAANWTGLNKSGFPEEYWKVEDGWLKSVPGFGHQDLISSTTAPDFELSWEWKASPGGNAGVKYLVREGRMDPYLSDLRNIAMAVGWLCLAAMAVLAVLPRKSRMRPPKLLLSALAITGLSAIGLSLYYKDLSLLRAVGLEYQMTDDGQNSDAQRGDLYRSGALYGLVEAKGGRSLEAGLINRSKIVVQGGQVEHYLNGQLTASYKLGSAPLLERIKESKFKNFPGFGDRGTGRIALQHHGDEMWFRDIQLVRLRRGAAPSYPAPARRR
ncbi:MAG: DUF1080 domain-containing protein [Acidimicrobiia bacterium]|nr:DUF1080 domain-containing protein [Acidimicrobiia bacterium]